VGPPRRSWCLTRCRLMPWGRWTAGSCFFGLAGRFLGPLLDFLQRPARGLEGCVFLGVSCGLVCPLDGSPQHGGWQDALRLA
jgi:hypothetical protein